MASKLVLALEGGASVPFHLGLSIVCLHSVVAFPQKTAPHKKRQIYFSICKMWPLPRYVLSLYFSKLGVLRAPCVAYGDSALLSLGPSFDG